MLLHGLVGRGGVGASHLELGFMATHLCFFPGSSDIRLEPMETSGEEKGKPQGFLVRKRLARGPG